MIITDLFSKDMCHVCGQTPCNCTHIAESVAEGTGNIGPSIKTLFQKIYDQGDDEIEYFYYESPVFAQYWDKYEGDIDSIVAEVDPKELQIIHDELEAYVEGAGLEEGLGKSIKRGLQGWGSPQDTPANIVKRNKAYDIDTAKQMRAGLDNAPAHSPAGLQKRVLDRRLKGVAEMDNRTSSDDRKEQRRNRPEEKARQDKEQQERLKSVSPEMRKKLRLPEPKEGMAEAGEWTKLPNGNYRNMHTGVQQSKPPESKPVKPAVSHMYKVGWNDGVEDEYNDQHSNDPQYDAGFYAGLEHAMGPKGLGRSNPRRYNLNQGVAEETENKDMTGQPCEKCKRGKYQETSIHDDMDGVLHCTKCGTKVDRWRAYKEPGVAEGTDFNNLVNVDSFRGKLKGREAFVRIGDPRVPLNDKTQFKRGIIDDREGVYGIEHKPGDSRYTYWLKDETGQDFRAPSRDVFVAREGVAEEKVRLDPKCWKGKKIGNPKTKMKGGVRVNNCVPAESVEENYDNGEYSDEAGMAHGNLITIAKAARGLLDTIDQHEDLPEWVQEKIAKVEGMLVSAWNYLQSQEAQGIDPRVSEMYANLAENWQRVSHRLELNQEFDMIESIVESIARRNGVDAETVWADLESLTEDELYVFAVTSEPIMEDWQKANKRDKTDGMSRKAVKAYRREHPGSKLQTAVTTKPSKLKKGSKASKRRKSYCSRSRGQMKMHHISCAKTPDKAICKARRRWNCEGVDRSGQTVVAEGDMYGDQEVSWEKGGRRAPTGAFRAPALSAANAAAEYQRSAGGYRGRVDVNVGSREEYMSALKALQNAAKQAGLRIEVGRVGDKMSVFSDSTGSDELGQFVDNTLKQGVAEADNLKGTPVVSLSDFGDKDNTKNRYGRTVPKKLKKDDPRVRFHKDYSQHEKKLISKMSNAEKADKGWRNPNIDEVSDETLTSYLTKVHTDSQKHEKDPTKRSPEKRNKSVSGFARAFNKLDARKEKVDELSKQKLGDYLHAAHQDVVDRATSSSFQSGKAGDKYNKADVSPKEKQRQAGMARAVSRLTRENSMADELARLAMKRNPNALVRVDGKTLQSPAPGPKPAGTTAPRPASKFDPEAEYSDDYSAWHRRTKGLSEGSSIAEAWARRYPNIHADIAECKTAGDGERLKRLMAIKNIIDSELGEQAGLGFGQ